MIQPIPAVVDGGRLPGAVLLPWLCEYHGRYMRSCHAGQRSCCGGRRTRTSIYHASVCEHQESHICIMHRRTIRFCCGGWRAAAWRCPAPLFFCKFVKGRKPVPLYISAVRRTTRFCCGGWRAAAWRYQVPPSSASWRGSACGPTPSSSRRCVTWALRAACMHESRSWVLISGTAPKCAV